MSLWGFSIFFDDCNQISLFDQLSVLTARIFKHAGYQASAQTYINGGIDFDERTRTYIRVG